MIDIPEGYYNGIKSIPDKQCDANMAIIKYGTPLPKGHGRIVDISQIDKDKIERDNPIMLLSINGSYIEVVSLAYLDNLQTIIEADHDSGS